MEGGEERERKRKKRARTFKYLFFWAGSWDPCRQDLCKKKKTSCWRLSSFWGCVSDKASDSLSRTSISRIKRAIGQSMQQTPRHVGSQPVPVIRPTAHCQARTSESVFFLCPRPPWGEFPTTGQFLSDCRNWTSPCSAPAVSAPPSAGRQLCSLHEPMPSPLRNHPTNRRSPVPPLGKPPQRHQYLNRSRHRWHPLRRRRGSRVPSPAGRWWGPHSSISTI